MYTRTGVLVLHQDAHAFFFIIAANRLLCFSCSRGDIDARNWRSAAQRARSSTRLQSSRAARTSIQSAHTTGVARRQKKRRCLMPFCCQFLVGASTLHQKKSLHTRLVVHILLYLLQYWRVIRNSNLKMYPYRILHCCTIKAAQRNVCTYGTASTIHGIVHAGALLSRRSKSLTTSSFFFQRRFLCGRIFVGAV